MRRHRGQTTNIAYVSADFNAEFAVAVTTLPPASGGDMEAAVYDPTAVVNDAFDMDNMVEGTDTKILSAAERSAIGALGSAAAADTTDFEPAGAVTAFAGTLGSAALADSTDFVAAGAGGLTQPQVMARWLGC